MDTNAASNNNLRLLPRVIGKNKLEELRKQAARVHPMVPRLQAEAELEYGQRKNCLTYVTNYHSQLESFIENATEFLDSLSDQEADLGIVGKFSLEEARRRMNLFSGMVQKLEAREALKKLPRGA